MKIVHLSDTHLGWRQMHYTDSRGRNIREQDMYEVFTKAVDKILELEPVAVIHAGDLFHGHHPSANALGVALDQLARLREAGILCVVIAGNHSTPRSAALDHPFSLLERFGVHAIHGAPRKIELGELAICAIPHSNDHEEMSRWIEEAAPAPGARFNVLTAHVGLDGLGHVGASEPGSTELSGEVLESAGNFDYIALGHLHKFDRPRINAVYSGSLEPLTWADEASRKGIVEVDLLADPFDEGFITLHEVTGRSRLALPAIDPSKAENLTEAICAIAESTDIKEAIVKLPVRQVSFEAFGAIEDRKIAVAFDGCLDLELDPQFTESGADGSHPAAPEDLREFLAKRTPRGFDQDGFIARAESYLTKAAEDLGA